MSQEERKRTLEEMMASELSKLDMIDRMSMRTSRATMSSQIENTFGWKNGLLRRPIERKKQPTK